MVQNLLCKVFCYLADKEIPSFVEIEVSKSYSQKPVISPSSEGVESSSSCVVELKAFISLVLFSVSRHIFFLHKRLSFKIFVGHSP